MGKETGENIGSFYQHYPRIAVVLSASVGGKDNAMAAAWHMPISFKPPLFGVSVSPKRFTYRLIAKSKEFAVNFLPASNVEIIAAVGGSKGDEVDKFKAFNIATDKSVKTDIPILKAAYAAFECKLVDDITCGDHQLLVGEIVAVHVSSEVFDEDGVLDLKKITPVLYMGAERYITEMKCSLNTLERSIYGQPKDRGSGA